MVKQLFTHPEAHTTDTLRFERSFWNKNLSHIAGTDEVGRGPLAGPVVAACVVLPVDCNPNAFQDSKKLSAKKRQEALSYLKSINAQIGIGIVDHTQIDEINILQASLLAMRKALEQIVENHQLPDYLLVDGNFEVPYPIAQTALIKGDSKSATISAASIVAKQQRDGIMAKLHQEFPQYNFIKNQGYPTKEHRQAIKSYGPSPHHRLSFNGVRQFAKK